MNHEMTPDFIIGKSIDNDADEKTRLKFKNGIRQDVYGVYE